MEALKWDSTLAYLSLGADWVKHKFISTVGLTVHESYAKSSQMLLISDPVPTV